MLKAATLLEKGYFPRELPPPFTTAAFGQIGIDDSKADRKSRTGCARHNLARVNGLRRPLKVPNPKSYVAIAKTIEELWPELSQHMAESKLSISRPVVTRSVERALRPHFRFSEKAKFRASTWVGQKFVLRTDISQFYGSIYTHSIPWALHGKAHAKSNLNSTPGDRLDKAMRDGSEGQTVGIPIGPDSSLLAAEVILAAVDRRLQSAIDGLRGFRYMDDYELAFRSRSEAEEALVVLEGALAEFELVVNPLKTRVFGLPEPLQAHWPHEIRSFPVRDDTPKRALTDLVALFSRAADLSKSNPGALKYALLRSRSIPVDRKSWPTFQRLVWLAVSSEPTTTASALDLLQQKTAEIERDVDVEEASTALDALILTNARVQNSSELAWALWAATELDVELTADAAGEVSTVADDFVALLALNAEAKGIFGDAALDRTMWSQLAGLDGALTGEHWLLAYEGAAQTWIPEAAAAIRKDPFFRRLAKHKVRFFDAGATRNPFTGPAGPLPGALVPDEYPF